MEKRQKAATESGALLAIIAGILIALNALSALGGYFRKDMTKAEKFQLSKGSGRLLQSMKQSMQVDVYVTKGLPKLDAFVRDLRDLLLEYKASSGGKFDFQIIEAKDEEQKKAAKEAGLVEQPFAQASATEDKAALVQGFMGLVFKYGAEKDVIKFLDPNRSDVGLEFWITNKVRELRDKADNVKHKVGVLTGHDEIKLTEANLVPNNRGKPNIQQILTQNFPFYTFQDVDLKGGDAEIDDALDGLIITQPGKDITEKELRRIDQFVLKGKSLAVFASAVNVKPNDPTMSASLNTHGLDKLLEGYGIEMRKDVVLDLGRPARVMAPTQVGMANVQIGPQFLDVQDDPSFSGDKALLDPSFAAFFRMPQIVFPFASSLVLKKDKQPGLEADKFKVVARSTPRSLRETSDSIDLKPFKKFAKKGEWDQFAIAASVEGKLKTAFPEGDKQGIERPDVAANPARILVVSSSQFLANPLARSGNGPDMGQMGMMMPMGGDEQLLMLSEGYAQAYLTTTILAFKNVMDWLSGDQDLLAVSAKLSSDPMLAYGDISKLKFDEESEDQLRKREEEMRGAQKRQQHMVELFLILGIPLLFSLYGVMRWRMRTTARLNVSLA